MTRALSLALAAVLTLGSCRSLTAPQTSGSDRGAARPPVGVVRDDAARTARLHPMVAASEDVRAQVPLVRRIDSSCDERGIHFRLHLEPEQLDGEPFYAPRTPGGWQFQLFLDVDQDRGTGYAFGFEYLTRDSEPDLAPGTVVLRRTDGGGGPGGWGDAVARLPVRVAPRLVMFTVPLDAIADDGVVDFALELYATVAGGADGATPVAHYARSYEGTSVMRRHDHELPPAPRLDVEAGGAAGAPSEPAAAMERLTSR